MTLAKLNNKYNKIITLMAKKELKTNKNLKEAIQDIQTHFKIDNYSLTYDGYKEMSKVRFSDIFNKCLELKGFTPYYNTKSSRFLIKRKRK